HVASVARRRRVAAVHEDGAQHGAGGEGIAPAKARMRRASRALQRRMGRRIFALASALFVLACSRDRTPIAIEPAAIVDASAPAPILDAAPEASADASADASLDATSAPTVTIEFRSVRTRTSIDPRTKRERYANDIEIVITRPDGTVARI